VNASDLLAAPVAPNANHSERATADRYARQERFAPVGKAGQNRLSTCTAVIFGTGALGGVSANLLARAGIGKLRMVDRDYVELSNLQRQSLFDERDVAEQMPKAVAAASKLREANSSIAIEPVVADATPANIERLIEGADVLVDGLDNFETRYLVNDAAVKFGIPWVYGGVIGSYGMTMTIRPGITPCLRCIFPNPPDPGSAPTCETAGVIGPAVDVVGAFQATEVLKLAIGDDAALSRSLLSIDLWANSSERIPFGAPRDGCPTCQQRDFTFLSSQVRGQSLALCGRDAIQVSVSPAPKLNLEELRDRLAPLGTVQSNRFLLRFNPASLPLELTIFPDGRAIVHGTTDSAAARSAYARFVGT
jgi:molybdopterin/thiamine biosynthesis adenylyltransferase